MSRAGFYLRRSKTRLEELNHDSWMSAERGHGLSTCISRSLQATYRCGVANNAE